MVDLRRIAISDMSATFKATLANLLLGISAELPNHFEHIRESFRLNATLEGFTSRRTCFCRTVFREC